MIVSEEGNESEDAHNVISCTPVKVGVKFVVVAKVSFVFVIIVIGAEAPV